MKTLEALNWLDELLKQEDMTQADLSRASGLDSGTISNIRNGKRRMGVDVAERIAKATHRKTQDILRMAGEIDDLPPDDPRFDRIETLYNTLEKEDNKQRAFVPPAIQSALRTVNPEDEVPASLPAASEPAIKELDATRKRIQHAYESGIYSIQEAEAKIKELEAKIKTLRDTEAQHAKQSAERQAFRFTLAEAQELLDDLPEWMLSDDPKIVNALLLRLIRQVNITPAGQAIPILRG